MTAAPVGLLPHLRIRETAFWRVQALIVLVTAAHVLLEQMTFSGETARQLAESLQHVSVGLYIVPVVSAGLAYGLEGGVLTALFCAALASVNIPIFHREGFAWVTELAFILVVVAVGVAVSVPVERERRQRRKAEAAVRRLAVLNEVGQASLHLRRAEDIADAALGRLVDVLDADGACLGLWRDADPRPVVLATIARDGDTASRLGRRVLGWARTGRPAPPADIGTTATAIDTGGLHGLLIVASPPGHRRTEWRGDVLASVGSQLAVAVENSLLRQLEREISTTYVRQLTRAQEAERTRLARDLHDGPVQDLTAVSRRMEILAAATGRATAPPLDELRRQLLATIGNLRRLGRDLRPSLLDDLGLRPALEWLVEDLSARTGIDAEVDSADDAYRRQDPEVESALFRIVQEALHNVERHSGAGRVTVTLSTTPHAVTLDVVDDGRGFTPVDDLALLSSENLGLIGMRERAELVGGTIRISTRPGDGTSVQVTIPVDGGSAPTCAAPSWAASPVAVG